MSRNKKIWIADDDRSIRWVLEKALAKIDAEISSYAKPRDLLERMQTDKPNVIISDIRMPGIDGISLLERIKQIYPDIPVIIMTAYSDLDHAVSSFQGGAFEYLSKPFDIDDVVSLVERALAGSKQNKSPKSGGESEYSGPIIGSAPAMQEIFRAIGKLSSSNMTVLITGESGTGKELVARALHEHSPRADHSFIAINTAAITKELIESELFGHEKGAFTGALSRHIGRFEQANGGTLFLDEIGDMPGELQTRLLRILAEGELYRVGSRVPIKVDVRIVAATHQDLEQRVREGKFREDLLHRLNVIRVHVPALRERASDIGKLSKYFLRQAAKELGTKSKRLLPNTEDHLRHLPWPGNVRQLQNFCRWATVMASSRDIHLADLPPELIGSPEVIDTTCDNRWEKTLRQWVESRLTEGGGDIISSALPKFESILIRAALKKTGGKRREAAKLLGWGRNTLTRKMKQYDLTA